jgi:hypothetical protein
VSAVRSRLQDTIIGITDFNEDAWKDKNACVVRGTFNDSLHQSRKTDVVFPLH